MIRLTQIRILILGLALAVFLSACGVTETETIELPQTISGELFGGTVELSYPAEWTAIAAEDTIRLANQEAFITEGITARRTGDIVGGALPVPKDTLSAFNLSSDAAMSEIARELAAEFGKDLPNLIVSSPSTFTANGQRGAVVAGTARGSDDSVGRMAIAVLDLGDAVAIVTISTYGDEVIPADYARAIVETFRFTAG